jgi:hypothetical protein
MPAQHGDTLSRNFSSANSTQNMYSDIEASLVDSVDRTGLKGDSILAQFTNGFVDLSGLQNCDRRHFMLL